MEKILPPTPENITLAATILAKGGLVAIPTETVYGLAADATNESAVKSIFALKGRPPTNPLIVHVATAEQALKVADFSNNVISKNRFEKLLASNFMPGPLSCVVPKSPSIASSVCAGLSTVCVRIPHHAAALQLIAEANIPLAAPSANRSSEISPSQATHVLQSFGTASPFIIDGGNCQVGLESTVLDITSPTVRILRAGAIGAKEIESILNEPVADNTGQTAINEFDQSPPPSSPGLQFPHYRPHTSLSRLSEFQGEEQVGVILFSEKHLSSVPQIVRYASRTGDHQEIAHNLYALLRELDGLSLKHIYIDSCDVEGLGAAIMDRVNRALE